MSTSLSQIIDSAGYDLNTRAGAEWLIGQVNQFEELVVAAEDLIENLDNEESESE